MERTREQPSFSYLLVKQPAYENDGGREIVKEYRIARFLETNIPSFVAGPFGLMCGITTNSDDYEERSFSNESMERHMKV